MFKSCLLIACMVLSAISDPEYFIPVNSSDRNATSGLILTEIGEFGQIRKERPGVAEHYHTGIDIKRPSGNYQNEPVFPIFEGVVISIRRDGPYAQLIIEHENGQKFWTVYEHIAGINVELFEHVNINTPIARFMNKYELNKYGWQFNHFHFEILKMQPIKLKRDTANPERLFASYTLNCYSKEDLKNYFYNPIEFLEQ